MKTEYTYLRFGIKEIKNKTSIWGCYNVNSLAELGEIKWYPQWRRYCYFPVVSAVYSSGCLDDIIDFIKQLMTRKYDKSEGS